MVMDSSREAGSPAAFEQDWQRVLAGESSSHLISPSATSGRQADLFEWIKVRQIEQLLQNSGITSGQILEYGCGAAGVSLHFAERGYAAHISDLSGKALQVAQRNKLSNFRTADFASATVADVLQLPYRANTFDVVMSFGLLEHFSAATLNLLMRESVRVLRPGGLFIADIVPGIGRLNVRTVGVGLSWAASSLSAISRGQFNQLTRLHQSYFDHYFENIFDDQTWKNILAEHNLFDIQVDVCRPFPPLAISGKAEAGYAALIKKMMAFHRRFDGANNRLTRRWGWMYLASGRKPKQQHGR